MVVDTVFSKKSAHWDVFRRITIIGVPSELAKVCYVLEHTRFVIKGLSKNYL